MVGSKVLSSTSSGGGFFYQRVDAHEELVWHGDMNHLGKVDIWGNLIHIKIIR